MPTITQPVSSYAIAHVHVRLIKVSRTHKPNILLRWNLHQSTSLAKSQKNGCGDLTLAPTRKAKNRGWQRSEKQLCTCSVTGREVGIAWRYRNQGMLKYWHKTWLVGKEKIDNQAIMKTRTNWANPKSDKTLESALENKSGQRSNDPNGKYYLPRKRK